MIWSWIVLVTRSWSSCWQTFRRVDKNDETAKTANWAPARRTTVPTASTVRGPKVMVAGRLGSALTAIARTTASISNLAM